MIKYSLITLGCPKNEVDSQHMKGFLSDYSEFIETDDFKEAKVIIINTCGFIQDAKEESIETILNAASYKDNHSCRSLIVTGCLTQRYSSDLIKEIPEIDAVLGTGNFDRIVEVIKNSLSGKKNKGVSEPGFEYYSELPRKLNNDYFAYLKIAEGCNNNCTYCSIPKIRGPVKSRKIEDIVTEAEKLAKKGIKELIIIAQDTTQYGVDIYGDSALTPLLKKLIKVKGIHWIRILYSYPEFIKDDLINLISREDKLCSYLDLPIQHSVNKIRKLMNRRGKSEDISNLINKLRNNISDIVIRTSLIVGFPGETEEDFLELKNFIKKHEFDRLGVFKFSREEDTAAYNFSDQVSEEVKEKRYEEIMELQQQIALKKNRKLIGESLEVIIEDIEDEYYLARSKYDAPEIDNQIYIKKNSNQHSRLKIGDFVICKIKEAYEYDLIGEISNESTE
ncbi:MULTISPECIES: 30S ribosomal protein S12 methylthiotransferase RimO [unclassified Halanaerobium]|uniref:30S ribosomal protein S12 methylthiotransferase RimO n=1 Tax=unclassified Halanaerobium TaxID=2641197 RepID=UPI000DF24362|nr:MULTISPECIES: 30S ribosomal protein S12 methylthiotransferase RimO [unclassified Halanaerobium]RCW51519.1 SSU ribosomal protein S12P methylthiotransferase [Halanaerobium sp. MA284_MarDTE_T2]RCW89307.1 SSU ribosomal protein S12P methylthiotransferase [Halanaerobium sp. DL-01]